MKSFGTKIYTLWIPVDNCIFEGLSLLLISEEFAEVKSIVRRLKMTSFVQNLKETKLAKEKENTLSIREVKLAQIAKVFWRTPACSIKRWKGKPQSRTV